MLLQRLSRQEAQNLLRYCLECGRVIPGKHFREELAKEGLPAVDAWGVLQKGQIYSEPEFHVGKQEWNYRVEGHEPGGKWLAIVFSFKSRKDAFLITVFSVEERRRQCDE